MVFVDVEVRQKGFRSGDKEWNVCGGKVVACGMATSRGIVGYEAIVLHRWMKKPGLRGLLYRSRIHVKKTIGGVEFSR
jgi:hypothetical protein